MGVRTIEAADEDADIYHGPRSEPPILSAVLVGLTLLVLLVANGRPLESGDTRVNEHVAASLVQEGNFDLDEYPALTPPFVREEGGHRVSIYPVASPVAAAPIFALMRSAVALDELGAALSGKLAASLFSAAAAAVLFLAVGRRWTETDAFWTAFVFCLGTTVWSTSQALWQHPLAVLGVCGALLFLSRAEDDDIWAGRAGLPIAVAVAARHADIAIGAVLAVATLVRWPRRGLAFLAWAAPVVVAVVAYQAAAFGNPFRHGFSDSLGRFDAAWGVGHLGLLVSPAKGLFVFSPVALLAVFGLVRALISGERFLAGAAGAAAIAHWLLVGRWGEWHGGESWGPRMMTDALPLLFLFLPEGMARLPTAARILGLVSVLIQALGAFCYDNRWERVTDRPATARHPDLWSVGESPIAFYARNRTVLFSLPAREEGKVVLREHPVVPFGPKGSRAYFAGNDLRLEGAPTFGDVHLQRGARVQGGRLQLVGNWSGLFLRVSTDARSRPLELQVRGHGTGVLYVGETSFWRSVPRWSTYPVSGGFTVRHRYEFVTSGGPDLVITVGRGGGSVEIDQIALLGPGSPESGQIP